MKRTRRDCSAWSANAARCDALHSGLLALARSIGWGVQGKRLFRARTYSYHSGRHEMRRSFRWLSVLALTILLAGCGTSTTRLAGKAATPTPTPLPTATPKPTATPSPTPKAVPQATLGADGHPCYASSVFPAARGANAGDFIAFAGLGNLAYPGSQLPEGLPLKPYKVPSIGAGASNSLPVNPGIGKGASGYNLFLCNASTSASHTINSVTARIASLTPYTGQLNEHPACDGPYARPGISGGGCGGGDPII